MQLQPRVVGGLKRTSACTVQVYCPICVRFGPIDLLTVGNLVRFGPTDLLTVCNLVRFGPTDLLTAGNLVRFGPTDLLTVGNLHADRSGKAVLL